MEKDLFAKIYHEITKDIFFCPSEENYCIAFVAGIGYGKTTVAKLLSKKLGIYIASNDYIRRTIEKYITDEKEEPSQETVNQLAFQRIELLLKNHIPFIFDCNGKTRYDQLDKITRKYHTKIYWIELKCSDQVARQRIINRNEHLEYNEYSRATIKTYELDLQKLSHYYFPEEVIDYTINTEENLLPQVEYFIQHILKNEKSDKT